MISICLGCDTSVEYHPSEPLMPLAVGNTWIYSSWYGTPTLADSFMFVIDKDFRMADGSLAYRRISKSLGEILPSFGWLYRNQSGGLYCLGGLSDTDTMFTEFLDREYPAIPGSSRVVPRLVFVPSTGQFAIPESLIVSVESVHWPVSTPAGNFNCVVYKYNYRPQEDVVASWNVYQYYCPGVGLVAQLIRNQFPGQPESQDTGAFVLLQSYQLN